MYLPKNSLKIFLLYSSIKNTNLFFPILFSELYDVCEILKGEFPSMQAGLTTRSLESAVARNDYLGRDFVKKKSVNPLRLKVKSPVFRHQRGNFQKN